MIPNSPTLEPTFLIFEFVDTELAAEARRKIDGWVRAFKLAHGQLSAVVASAGDGEQLIVRLAFQPGEQLSFERWLERIPAEEPFDSADCRALSHSDRGYTETSDTFTRLTSQ